MHKILFRTGVKRENHLYLSGPQKGELIQGEHEEWHNGQLCIAFYLNEKPPENYHLEHLQPDRVPLLPGQMSIPIIGGGMLSKYAVFTVMPTTGEK
jgi:hypothetical protein